MKPEERLKQQEQARSQYAATRLIAMAAAIFSLTVCCLLIINHLRLIYADPVNSEVMRELIATYNADPGDADKQAQIRAMDLLARKALFNGLQFSRTGSYLLATGLAIWILALKRLVSLRSVLPNPKKYNDIDETLSQTALTRWLVSLFGVFIIAAVSAITLSFRSEVPDQKVLQKTDPEVTADPPGTNVPGWEIISKNWPAFRGPNGTGVSQAKNIPTHWDGATQKNIRWKSPMGKPGFSSPVVWNDRLFITGADEDSRDVSCYNTEKGALLWTQSVPKLPGPPIAFPNVDQDTGFAPITPATDGTRLFAMFNTGELACFDFEGSFLWGKNFGLPDNPMGHASSLAIYQDLLVVQMDQEKGSELLALNTTTGKVVWQTRRAVASAWSSPIWAEFEGATRIFLNGSPLIAAYDARSGNELWSIDCMEGEVCPSPSFGGGKALFVTEYARMHAIDVQTGAEAWSVEEAFPDVSSPVATDTAVFFGNNSGMITCLNLANGEVAWTKEFDDGFYSSPIAVGNTIYFTDMGGVTHIFKAGLSYDPIADPALGEAVVTTPAYLDGRIYMRGNKHLYCIGEAP